MYARFLSNSDDGFGGPQPTPRRFNSQAVQVVADGHWEIFLVPHREDEQDHLRMFGVRPPTGTLPGDFFPFLPFVRFFHHVVFFVSICHHGAYVVPIPHGLGLSPDRKSGYGFGVFVVEEEAHIPIQLVVVVRRGSIHC